jgi:hypothetical protein
MPWYTGQVMVTVEFQAEDNDAAERHLNELGSDMVAQFDDCGTTKAEIHDYCDGLE